VSEQIFVAVRIDRFSGDDVEEPDNWIGVHKYRDVPYLLTLFKLSIQVSEQIFVAVGIGRFPGDATTVKINLNYFRRMKLERKGRRTFSFQKYS